MENMNLLIIAILVFVIITILAKLKKPVTDVYDKDSSPAPTVDTEAIKDFQNGNINLRLVSAGDNKLQLLKEIREITGFGLKEAKNIVDFTPSIICKNIDEENATIIKKRLENIGATIELEINIE